MVGIAKEAVDRLSAKLAGIKGSGQPVDMAEEFRMLTLQVIGEAILSLPPEECDKVPARNSVVPLSSRCYGQPAYREEYRHAEKLIAPRA